MGRGTLEFALACLLTLCIPIARTQEPSAGYLLVSGWYKDRGVQRDYTRAVAPVLKAHGYETAVIAGMGYAASVIEGDWIPGETFILLKFPSENQVKAFWWSPEYQEARGIRAGASLLDVLQLDGVPGVRARMDGRSPTSSSSPISGTVSASSSSTHRMPRRWCARMAESS